MRLLTRAGATILALCLASYLAGWQFGWDELMVCASACGLALVIALGFVVGRHRLVVVRTLSNDRVTVGDEATSTLVVSNPTRTPIGNRNIEEPCGDEVHLVDISGLAPGATMLVEHTINTDRRGIIQIGPAKVAKSDPLGLMRREAQQAGVDELWVQPRLVSVNPVPVGFAKDLEGPTSDTSPAGDVSFHTLRPYEVGDDHRHVHWLSTARAGTLMVRHYVDNRRPHLTVVLDVEPIYPDAGFELAVSVAASLVVYTQRARQPVALRSGDRHLTEVLDDLTVIQPSPDPLAEAVRSALMRERETSALVIVTGPRPPETMLAMIEEAKRSTHVIVIRCCSESDGVRLPGTTTFSIDDLDAFAIAWNRSVR